MEHKHHHQAEQGRRGSRQQGPTTEEGEEADDGRGGRSVVISALVRQVKERRMSKGELFQELSSLQQQQQQQRRASLSPNDGSSVSTGGVASHHRRSASRQRPESDSVADGRLIREHGRFGDSSDGGSSVQDAGGPGIRRRLSDAASIGSASPQPPASNGGREPVSGFSDPDRRAFIQRLLEEKRKGSAAGGGGRASSSNSSNNNNDGEALSDVAGRRSLEVDTAGGGYPPHYHHQRGQSAGGSSRRSGSAPRPRGGGREGSSSRYPAYPSRASMDDMEEIMRGAAYRSGDGGRSASPFSQQKGVTGGGGSTRGYQRMDSDCTFKPKIKDLPRHYGTMKDKDLSFQNRVSRWHTEKLNEAAKRRQDEKAREVDGCTFHPTINAASRRSVESARLPSDHRSVNERLYDHVNKIKEQRARVLAEAREEEEKKLRKECTFKPNLRTASSRPANSRSGSPQIDKVSSRYLSSPQRPRHIGVPAGMEECTFRPHVNPVPSHMGSARVYLEANVVDRLTRHTSSSSSSYPYEDGDMTPDLGRSPRAGWEGGGVTSLDRPVIDLPSFMSSIQGGPGSARGVTPPRHAGKRPSSAPTRRRGGMDGNNNNNNRRPHYHAPTHHHHNSYNDDSYTLLTRAEREERRRAFHEFLARQTQRELHKQKKMKEIADKCQPKFSPKLSKLSMLLFRQQNKGSFLERMERDALKKERLADKLRLMREAADRACTFRPEITKKSAEKQARTPVEMSRGDMLRKETNARLLRLRFEKERYSNFTFQPRLNLDNAVMGGRIQSKLRILSEPDTYIDRLSREVKRKAETSRRVLQEREMAEVAECTFKPQTQECPAFIKRIARSLALTKTSITSSSREDTGAAQAAAEVRGGKPEWR